MTTEILATVISSDPFLWFGASALFGRDRLVKLHKVCRTVDEYQVSSSKTKEHVVICDLDTAVSLPSLDELNMLLQKVGSPTRILCLIEGKLPLIPAEIHKLPLHSVMAKSDLEYSLHLAVRAVQESSFSLITKKVAAAFTQRTFDGRKAKVVLPTAWHPKLTDTLIEVALWRIFLGLDNPDIQHELAIGKYTVREYESKVYQQLGAENELDAFEILSNWWWDNRFAPLF